MKTILFGWELGANLGHLVPISRIAREMEGDSYRLVYAVRDLGNARVALGPDATILQAPVWPAHRHFGASGALASYADVLAAVGYGDPAKLGAVVAAWTSLLDFVKPDVVVADHSPGLLLTLAGGPIPAVAIGSAFTMPPLDYDRFPPLRADRSPAVPEARLLESARTVQSARNRPMPARLVDVLRTQHRVVFGLPELDPYASFRRELIAAPPEGLPGPLPPPDKTRLFVYFGTEVPHQEILAQALAELETPLEVYLRGEVGPIPVFLQSRGVRVHDRPPPLAEVLGRVSHILTQGGALTAAAAYVAGRPQLVAPQQSEAEITLGLLEQRRVGRRLNRSADLDATRNAIRAFLADRGLADNARLEAERIAMRQLPDGAAVTAEAIRQSFS